MKPFKLTRPASALNFEALREPALLGVLSGSPVAVQKLADEKYALLKSDPQHPSLHFKRVGRIWSARVGLHYRVLGADGPAGVVWFWIGTHAEYDRLVG